jgi:small GTP-binding protein
MPSYRFKLIVAGNSGVGKTAFLRSIQDATTKVEERRPTLGTDVNPLTFNLARRGSVTFNTWDKADYYHGAQAGIVMFDITDPDSFKAVDEWRDSIRAVCPGIPIVYCASKADCEEKRQVSHQEIADWLAEKRESARLRGDPEALSCISVSAKTGHNREKPFLYLARLLTDKYDLAFK